MASTNKNMIRIRLKAYDHQLIGKAAETIVEAARGVSGNEPQRKPFARYLCFPVALYYFSGRNHDVFASPTAER